MGNDEGGTLETWVKLSGIPIAVALWVVLRSLYYEGYADALGVPDQFSLTPQLSLWSLMASAFLAIATVFAMASAIAGLVTSERRGARWLGYGLLFVYAPFGAGMLVVALFDASRIESLIVMGMALALLVAGAIASKLESVRKKKQTPEPVSTPPSGPVQAGGANPSARPREPLLTSSAAVGVGVAIFFAAVGARAVGRWQASSRETWVVIGHPQLPVSGSGEPWVVLGRTGDSALVSRVSGKALTYPYQVVTLTPDNTPITLEPRKLGSLKPPPR